MHQMTDDGLRVSIGIRSETVRPLSSDGAIAQLGERLLCKQEVVGSIPSGSTRRLRSCRAVRSWLIVFGDGDDCRLQCAANKQLLVRANSIRRVVDFAFMALVGGARVI